MSRVLFDASAILAVLRGEPGRETVAGHASAWAISAVNAAEVAAKLVDGGMPDHEVRTTFDNLALEIIPFDAETALVSGLMRAATRHKGLSLGDRACLAQGRISGEPVLTTDKAWDSLDLGVEIRVVR
ncbi:MAG: type II toxin-antitoxin system VapC family toxin [Pseudomonadota bacterium]